MSVPILETVWVPARDGRGRPGATSTARTADNEWEVVVGQPWSPALRLRVQLDVCGAWLTMANVQQRPVVVRRAGWSDLRGQPPSSPGERWDRVGLGPGDALLAVVGEPLGDEALLELGLDGVGKGADQLARSAAAPGRAAFVLRVPELAAEGGVERLAAATGLPPARFAEPIHRPGSPEAELWASRPPAPREARLRVPPSREAVPRTRGLLRRLLGSWRMPELLDGPVELLASELVTNAVVHAGTPLDVSIRFDGRSLVCGVADGSPAHPVRYEPSLEAEGGRGIWLVDTLAERWGVDPTGRGKRVWFAVPAAP